MALNRVFFVVFAGALGWALAGCGSDSPVGGGEGDSDTAVQDAQDIAPSDVQEPDQDADPLSDADSPQADAPDQDGRGPATPQEMLAEAVQALCPAYAALWCQAQAACGCDEQPGFPADCAGPFESACAFQLAGYLPAVQSGQAFYRPDNAPVCLQAVGQAVAACVLLPQSSFFSLCPILQPAFDDSALPGQGQPCQGLCAASLVCSSGGTCAPPAAAGKPCQTLSDCAPGLVCTGSGQCAAPSFPTAGEPCGGPADCAPELSCGASVMKICQPKVAGGPCTYSEQCPLGEYCATDETTGEPTECAPLPTQGQPCANGVYCAEGLACHLSSAECRALPVGGEDCALGRFGPVVCASGFACLDGVCGQPPGLGEPCAMGDAACAAPLACSFESRGSFCRQRVAAGAPCQNDVICQEGLFCDFAVLQCTPYVAPGGPCSGGNECGPGGACLPDANFSFRCTSQPLEGEPCFIDECAGDLLCQSPYTEGVCVPPICGALKF